LHVVSDNAKALLQPCKALLVKWAASASSVRRVSMFGPIRGLVARVGTQNAYCCGMSSNQQTEGGAMKLQVYVYDTWCDADLSMSICGRVNQNLREGIERGTHTPATAYMVGSIQFRMIVA